MNSTAEVAAVLVAPFNDVFSIVTEAELLVDPTPLTGRVLGRVDLSSGLSVGVGVQVPYNTGPWYRGTAQLIGQARYRW